MKPATLALWLCVAIALPASAQTLAPSPDPRLDLDRDGIADSLEQVLLERFLPQFRISAGECDVAPALFRPGREPIVEHRDGTIYGQVFPRTPHSTDAGSLIELHFYHLWQKDCGKPSHPLDAEHVSVLVRAGSTEAGLNDWKALYWFASAHQGTLCDKSHAASASKVQAIDSGAVVTISAGKHASYLEPVLCDQGCGADRCDDSSPLQVARVINLGEPGHPLNGSEWTDSQRWLLRQKMNSEFPDEVLAALQAQGSDGVLLTRSLPRGTQQTIKTAGTTANALTAASDATCHALDKSDQHTANALDASAHVVGNALQKAASSTGRFLRSGKSRD